MCVVLSKAQADLEEELKKESISDISSRAILMLDKLQSILYHKQIQKIEEFFREEINLLMDAIVQYMIERRWANDEKAERKKYLFKLAQQSKKQTEVSHKIGGIGDYS